MDRTSCLVLLTTSTSDEPREVGLDIVVMYYEDFDVLILETCKSSSVERRRWKSLGVWQIYLCFIRPQKSMLLQRELLVSVVHKLSQFSDSESW